MDDKNKKQFVDIIELLRGIAALGVVCFHYTNSTLPTIKPNLLGSFFEWAKLGIPMFFIISGYVIPLSMYKSGYILADAGRFFSKRMARMIPPAWVAMLLMMGVYFVGYYMNGRPIENMAWPGTDFRSVFANFFFSYDLMNVEKYIEAYWTLEVEFQYYILIPFLFPIIMHFVKKPIELSIIFLLMLSSHWLYNDTYLFLRDNSFFVLGFILFLYKAGQINRNYFLYASFVATVFCYIQQGVYGSAGAVMAILTINYVKLHNPVTSFLGMISFSLYITHKLSGVVAEFFLRNLSGMTPSDPVKILMFFVYLAIAITFAFIFYKLVEAPSLKLSKKIRIHKQNNTVK